MTGAELLAQVRELVESYGNNLDGCVLLTAEEAVKVRLYVWQDSIPNVGKGRGREEVLALLTPAGKEET